MDGLTRDPAQCSQLELLVTQQRYEESLKLLNQAIAQNPQDHDACLYRLLVVRIVVLRRQITELQPLYFSKHSVLSVWSALARLRRNIRRAALRDVTALRFDRSTLRIGVVVDFVTSRAQRLRAVLSSQSWLVWTKAARRLRPFPGGRIHLPRLLRKPSPVAAVSALSLLAVGSVTIVLLSRADTSYHRSASVQGTVAVPSVTVKPQAALPAAPSDDRTPAEIAALSRPVEASAPKAVDEERSSVRNSQVPVATKTPQAAEASNAEPKALTKESKKPAKTQRQSEPMSRKTQRAMRQDSVEGGDMKNLPSAAIARTSNYFYRTRRPIAVRQAAKHGAPTVEKLSEGAVVAVLDVKDSWARITLNGKAPGFVRVEYLGPVEIP